MEKQLSQYEQYYNKWENTKKELEEKYYKKQKDKWGHPLPPHAPKLKEYIGYGMKRIAITSLILFLIFMFTSVVGCTAISCQSQAEITESEKNWYQIFSISSFGAGGIFYPICLLIGVLIRMDWFRSYKRYYNKLIVNQEEYFRKMNEFAQPEIEKHRTSAPVLKITSLFFPAFKNSLTSAKRDPQFANISNQFIIAVKNDCISGFKFDLNGKSYDSHASEESNTYSSYRATFNFAAERMQSIHNPCLAYALVNAIFKNLEEKFRKEYPKDESGTTYSLTTDWIQRYQWGHTYGEYYDIVTHHWKSIDNPEFNPFRCLITYSAPNGNYKTTKSWSPQSW